MKQFILLPIAILSLAATSFLIEPDPIQEKLILNLKQWFQTYPQEKVFIQMNRQQFTSGEQIWFKGWCTFQQKPSFLSRLAYVDVVDEQGKVVDKYMYQMDSLGSWYGQIDIPRKWKSGNYTLRGYTAWMLNQPEYIFHQPFFIYGENEVSRVKTELPKTLQVKFFPEGGQWIAGVENRMAFVILDEMGLPVNVPLLIKDATGKIVTTAPSIHQGMGVFTLTPEQEVYKAEIQTAGGGAFTYALPPVQPEGIQLTVINNSPARLFVSVQRGNKGAEKIPRVLVMAHMSGKLVYSTFLDFEEGLTTAPILKKNLPPGIMQITILDTLGNPLAERLTFIENYEIVKPQLIIEKKQNTRRAENSWQLNTDLLNPAAISVMINDAAIDNKMGVENSIASHLLLTSDIKGYVQEPGFYFQNKSPETLQKLDLLMMVHGWRKFTWKQILNNEAPTLRYPIESNLQLKGKVTKSDRTEVIKDGKVSFIIKGEDSTTYLIDAILTDKGEFLVDSVPIRNKATVSYMATNNKKENLVADVTFYPSLLDTLKAAALPRLVNLDTMVLANRKSQLAKLLYNQLAIVDTFSSQARYLGNVTVTTKKLSRIDSIQRQYVSSFFEMSDQTLEVINDRGYINIWQFLQREIPGLGVNPFEPGGVQNVVFNRFSGMVLGNMNEDGSMTSGTDDGVMFFLNEIPVPIGIIDALNPEEVALVKVYKGTLAFPFGANAGAIGIYTKKGKSGTSNKKQFVNFQKQGYAVVREFYQVDYQKTPDLNKGLIDKRTTLYWNPRFRFDSSGKGQIRFYNSDFCNEWKLVVQGIDSKGRMIYTEEIVK
ncbi:MAG: hypothetical protein ACK5CP_10585 [Bacteroidota bacterium]|jgi:hypothetical protein